MPKHRPTTVEILAPLDGREFAEYRGFEEAVLALFNANLHHFPPQYSYLDLIGWGRRQGWFEVEGRAVRVRLAQSDKRSGGEQGEPEDLWDRLAQELARASQPSPDR